MMDPLVVTSLLALMAGIALLIAPHLLSYILAAYLILIGLAGLFPALFLTHGGAGL